MYGDLKSAAYDVLRTPRRVGGAAPACTRYSRGQYVLYVATLDRTAKHESAARAPRAETRRVDYVEVDKTLLVL